MRASSRLRAARRCAALSPLRRRWNPEPARRSGGSKWSRLRQVQYLLHIHPPVPHRPLHVSPDPPDDRHQQQGDASAAQGQADVSVEGRRHGEQTRHRYPECYSQSYDTPTSRKLTLVGPATPADGRTRLDDRPAKRTLLLQNQLLLRHLPPLVQHRRELSPPSMPCQRRVLWDDACSGRAPAPLTFDPTPRRQLMSVLELESHRVRENDAHWPAVDDCGLVAPLAHGLDGGFPESLRVRPQHRHI